MGKTPQMLTSVVREYADDWQAQLDEAAATIARLQAIIDGTTPPPPPPPVVWPRLWVDVSWWQDKSLPWVALDKANVIGNIVRMTRDRVQDQRAPMHVADARAANKMVRGYGWADPTVNRAEQVDAVVLACKTHRPEAWAVDAEQWWRDWSKWWLALEGKIPKSEVPKYTPAQLSEFYRLMALEVQQATGLETWTYTGTWFIAEYALPMLGWLHSFKSWLAHYVNVPTGVQSAEVIVAAAEKLATVKPWLIAGQPLPLLRQFSSTLILRPLPEDGEGK